MSKLKKAAVILAVTFVAAIGAGWAIFDAVADYTAAQLEANKK